MGRLSNLLRLGDASGSDRPIHCRPAERSRGEIEAALRLILAESSSPASDEQVLDFLSFAIDRRIDVNLTWLAEQNGRVVWALLPIVSPGRTMLLLSPNHLPRKTPRQSVVALSNAVFEHFRGHGLVLAQVLLDPRQRALRDAYIDAGFEHLAELLYLHRRLSPPQDPPSLPAGWSLHTYTANTHARFADAIQRSYASSLDCPGLNGMRSIEDVVRGHQATGQFDPSLWFLLSDGGEGAGVLLLNPTLAGEALELVYLGVTPELRGRGAADLLMRLTLHHGLAGNLHDLSLAVDARNQPAQRLYYRHGLKRVGSRMALVRDLRRACPASAPACG